MWMEPAVLSPPRPTALCLPRVCRYWHGGTRRGVALVGGFFHLRVSSSFLRPSPPNRRNHRRNPPKPSPPDRKLEFSFDVGEVADRVTADLRRLRLTTEVRVRRFVSSAKEAYHDLRTFVRVEDGRRVVFSCNRSSLLLVADVLLWGAVAVVLFRVLAWLVTEFGRSWGFGDWRVVRRDRSLGGREMVVGRRRSGWEDVEWRSSRALRSPLSLPRGGEMRNSGVAPLRRVSREEKMPEWWPDPVPVSPVVALGKEELQREANGLVRAIMDNRMSGNDYREEDMIQLRQLCRSSGLKVSFNTVNARDSFYRASVGFILNACIRVSEPACKVVIDGEDVRHFIAGLADNIGLGSIHAVHILRGAIAATTRSRFLQAWVLEAQGQRSEALEELAAICHIFQIFPPEKHSVSRDGDGGCWPGEDLESRTKGTLIESVWTDMWIGKSENSCSSSWSGSLRRRKEDCMRHKKFKVLLIQCQVRNQTFLPQRKKKIMLMVHLITKNLPILFMLQGNIDFLISEGGIFGKALPHDSGGQVLDCDIMTSGYLSSMRHTHVRLKEQRQITIPWQLLLHLSLVSDHPIVT